MITFEEFRKKALSNPEVKEEYKSLKPVFEIKKQLLQARKMNTSKSNI